MHRTLETVGWFRRAQPTAPTWARGWFLHSALSDRLWFFVTFASFCSNVAFAHDVSTPERHRLFLTRIAFLRNGPNTARRSACAPMSLVL